MRPHQAVLLAATAITIAVTATFVLYGDRGSKKYGVAAIGGPFTLLDQSGRSLTEKDLKGSYSLIYFGYTFCPDVCPTGLQVMSNAMDQLQTEMQRKSNRFLSQSIPNAIQLINSNPILVTFTHA